MSVFEVLTIFLISVLATATTAAIYLGLLNWIGALFVVRCAACHHLTFSSAKNAETSCPHCRHPVLTHPIHALHHPRSVSKVRVVGDRLHY
jgi:DNA-directed RNA polymerase subunit RPC12/RpoP